MTASINPFPRLDREFSFTHLQSITYHTRTGRVSVAWTAEPKGVYESIKLAMIAPPNDEVERRIIFQPSSRESDICSTLHVMRPMVRGSFASFVVH